MAAIRILIVDDHKVVRQGLTSLLDLEPDLQVVAEAGTGAEALGLLGTVNPDILLLDLRLPDLGGAQVCRQAISRCPHLPVLILTAITNGPEVLECIDAGAKGYVLKDVDVSELIRTIRAVHRGESVLDPRVTQAVMDSVRHARGGAASEGILTEQELGIVRLMAQGLTNKEIGQRLFLSPNTIKAHISEIMQKLGVKRRAEVVFRVTESHLI
jgi:two-component system, NarL family, response regulator DevR